MTANLIPTLAEVLDTFAYHVESIATSKPTRTDAPYKDRDRFGLGLGGYAPDCPRVAVDVELRPSIGAEPWGVWAGVYIRPMRSDDRDEEDRQGFKHCGNRCGGRKEYAALCAPVLAWVAAYHAGKGAT